MTQITLADLEYYAKKFQESVLMSRFTAMPKDPNVIQFKIKYQLSGGHVHCNLYTRWPPTETWARCGAFAMSVEDWGQFKTKLHESVVLEERH